MPSLQRELDEFKAIVTGLHRQFEKGSKTSNELQTLFDATAAVQAALLHAEFRKRSDAARLFDDIGNLTDLASRNLDELQVLILPPRPSKKGFLRSPRADPEDTSRGHEIFSNLQKHTTAFQKLAGYILDREGRERLAFKALRAPSIPPDARSRLQPIEPDRVTISIPPSPFQASVEDAEESEEEQEVKHNIETYQCFPKDDSPTTEEKSHPRRVVPPPTPPQLIVRQATDPTTLDSPRRPPEGASSPLRSASGVDEELEDRELGTRESEPSHHLHPTTLPRLVTKIDRPVETLRDVEEKIARLQGQRQKYVETEARSSSSDRRKSKNRHSVDLSHTDEYLNNDTRRHRAYTSTGNERPRSFIEGSTYDPYKSDMPPPRADQLRRTHSTKTRRPISRSPRAPFSTTDAQLDYYGDFGYGANAAEVFGTDPRTSLPTVLEGAGREGRRPRSAHRGKRSSTAFESMNDNFYDYFKEGDGHAADFPLFSPPPIQPSQSAQPRSRGNSQAKTPSPNSKPYMSPRQLQESMDLEPNVREIKVSLEDLFDGTTKRLRVWRKKYNPQTGMSMDEEGTLEVPIDRGLKPGSKIKFEGAGDQTPEGTKELHFQLAEKPHPVFTRTDYDLHCTLEITLAEALCGWERSIRAICGREVRFSHPGPTLASWKDNRAGLGMCKFKNPNERGDLIAAISIKMPGPLSDAQKALIRRALGRPENNLRSSTYAY